MIEKYAPGSGLDGLKIFDPKQTGKMCLRFVRASPGLIVYSVGKLQENSDRDPIGQKSIAGKSSSFRLGLP
jgi:hypothetical protein